MFKQLLPLVARYTELSTRERAMLGVAAVAVVYFLLDTLLVTPGLEQQKALAAKAASQQEERAALQGLLRSQAVQASAALTQAQAERDALQSTVSQGEQILGEARLSTEVAPLLRRLVQTTPGLQLSALRTSPSTVFFQPQAAAPPAPASGTAPPAPQPAAAPPVVLPTLHAQAVEATVQGNYLDLLAYLRQLREHPRTLYWDTASITVSTYPLASLRLVLNLLSTQPDTPAPANVTIPAAPAGSTTR